MRRQADRREDIAGQGGAGDTIGPVPPVSRRPAGERAVAGEGELAAGAALRALKYHAADGVGIGRMSHAVEDDLRDRALPIVGLGRRLVIDRHRQALFGAGAVESSAGGKEGLCGGAADSIVDERGTIRVRVDRRAVSQRLVSGRGDLGMVQRDGRTGLLRLRWPIGGAGDGGDQYRRGDRRIAFAKPLPLLRQNGLGAAGTGHSRVEIARASFIRPENRDEGRKIGCRKGHA